MQSSISLSQTHWKALACVFLLLTVIISECYGNQKEKIDLQEKNTQKNLCEGYHFSGCTSFFLCQSLSFFRLPRFYEEKKIPPQNSRGKEGLLPPARPRVYNPARPSVYNPAILPYFDFSLPSVELIKLIGSWKKKYFQGRGKEFAHWVLNDAILNYKRKWVQTLCLPTLIVSRNF